MCQARQQDVRTSVRAAGERRHTTFPSRVIALVGVPAPAAGSAHPTRCRIRMDLVRSTKSKRPGLVSCPNNLAAREPERVSQLRARLAAWRTAMDARTNSPNVNYDAESHRVLYEDVDVSHYNPATADEAARDRLRAWRKQMDAAVRRR
jgi:hypothetical protein